MKLKNFTLLFILITGNLYTETTLPVIPVGTDAYLQWDRWPYHRVGARAYMRSTYDRAGGNESADASHFLYQEREDFNVTLDVEGRGVLYFVRTNHWHGSPWHYEVDGRDHIVQETSTADPTKPKPNSVFIPEAAFPNPLTWTWSETKGADLNWVPIMFEKSLRLAYSRTRYGTGYYIFHQFLPDTPLSRELKSWNEESPPGEVLKLISRAGSDVAPQSGLQETSGTVEQLLAGEAAQLAQLTGPAMLRALEFTVPRDQATSFSRATLRITWDERTSASVDAPVSLFFGAGTLYNRDNREYLVKAFPAFIKYLPEKVHLACFFPMPFLKSAKIELIGAPGETTHNVEWRCRYEPYRDPPHHVGYFHATYRDFPTPVDGKDLVMLDTREAEGGGDWHGHFVGMSWIFSHNAQLGTLEGDPRFFFDDSQSPQAYGTGTEEWGGGGDYWGGRNMTLPFAGHPTGAPSSKEAKSEEDKIESAYRFLLADLMPFGRRARICLEHGGTNDSKEHYEAVTYWYGSPGAILVKTDDLDVGTSSSEAAHDYSAPGATEPYLLRSRYELGVDSLHGKEVYPAHEQNGRVTTGTTEFTLKLDPENIGLMLRRTLDYSFPNQRARVFVADVGTDNWKNAGVWYTAGSNSCLYSDPPGELDPTKRVVQTSNRRFRDDEFLISGELTRGKAAIRVRVQGEPVNHRLIPGYPQPAGAWSELSYSANCYVVQKD